MRAWAMGDPRVRTVALVLLASVAGPALARAQPAPASPAIPAAPAAAPEAPAASPPPRSNPPVEAAAGTPAMVIDDKQIESVLGRSVLSPTGDDMGRIVDVLADKAGDPRAVVIDFGGFFGVGSRKIAVDWHSLHFKDDNKADSVIVDLPRDKLKGAPVYKEGEPVVVLGRAAPVDPKKPDTPPPPTAPN